MSLSLQKHQVVSLCVHCPEYCYICKILLNLSGKWWDGTSDYTMTSSCHRLSVYYSPAL